MGSWTDLTLNNDVMDGIAPIDLRDPDFDVYDTDAISTNVANEAKGFIEMRLSNEFPDMINDADGPIEFLDAALDISKAHVTNLVNRTVGYCAMWQFYETQAMSNSSIQINRAGWMRERFDMAFHALVHQLRIDSDFVTQLETTVDDSMGRHSAPTFMG
jgi:hypothetical protein